MQKSDLIIRTSQNQHCSNRDIRSYKYDVVIHFIMRNIHFVSNRESTTTYNSTLLATENLKFGRFGSPVLKFSARKIVSPSQNGY